MTLLPEHSKILLDIFIKSPVKGFRLSGGTALAVFYLYHRESQDLDFFTETEIYPQRLNVFLSLAKKKGYSWQREIRGPRWLHTFFYKDQPVVKTDFDYHPFEPIERPLRWKGILVDSLLDIAVNKLQAITTRLAARDFVDLYFLIQRKQIDSDIKKLAQWVRLKFGESIDAWSLGARLLRVRDLADWPQTKPVVKKQEYLDFYSQLSEKLAKEDWRT